jgi:hypothetical protein
MDVNKHQRPAALETSNGSHLVLLHLSVGLKSEIYSQHHRSTVNLYIIILTGT